MRTSVAKVMVVAATLVAAGSVSWTMVEHSKALSLLAEAEHLKVANSNLTVQATILAEKMERLRADYSNVVTKVEDLNARQMTTILQHKETVVQAGAAESLAVTCPSKGMLFGTWTSSGEPWGA